MLRFLHGPAGSVYDAITNASFIVITNLHRPTFVRLLWILCVLLPLYTLVLAVSALPRLLFNLPLLVTYRGRSSLIASAKAYRARAVRLAEAQLDDQFRFAPWQLLRGFRVDAVGWGYEPQWLEVEGARAAYYRIEPTIGVRRSGRTIVLLHGNPSWSYMYRSLVPLLQSRGDVIIALDWIGHGSSDKPLEPSTLTIELHIATLNLLLRDIVQPSLRKKDELVFVAHDWGGCILSLALPRWQNPPHYSLFFLNSFLPPDVNEISMNHYLLYLTWFLTTGILGTHTSEALVTRYMEPHISSRAVGGYTAPTATVGPAARESIVRFSRAIPGLPRSFYPFLKEPPDWYLLMEGTIGPDVSEGILQQVRLVEMDPEARSCLAEGRMLKHALVACSTSRKDTFLSELARNVWSTLPDKAKEWRRDRFKRMAWIDAGHNPLEECPAEVAALLVQLEEQP